MEVTWFGAHDDARQRLDRPERCGEVGGGVVGGAKGRDGGRVVLSPQRRNLEEESMARPRHPATHSAVDAGGGVNGNVEGRDGGRAVRSPRR